MEDSPEAVQWIVVIAGALGIKELLSYLVKKYFSTKEETTKTKKQDVESRIAFYQKQSEINTKLVKDLSIQVAELQATLTEYKTTVSEYKALAKALSTYLASLEAVDKDMVDLLKEYAENKH